MPSTRRHFLRSAALLTLGARAQEAPQVIVGKPTTGLRIEKLEFAFEDFKYRAPYKFGGTAVDRVTLLNVTVEISTPAGKFATGFGSMPMGNIWAFPSKTMSYETTLGAMRELAKRIARITGDFKETAHPIEINHLLEPDYLKAAAEVSKELALAEPIPKLCTQVTASAFDAALHDAFGKALGLNCYQTYSTELMGHDLARYLNADFKGESLEKYVTAKPRDWIWLFHSVGGLDAVTPDELKEPLKDGMPETLAEWIKRDGLQRIKIKLQGENLEWDIARTVAIDRVARETRPEVEWKYCCDFNEHCPSVEYLLEYLRKVKEQSPKGFESILYLEQPTRRDLRADRGNLMHEAAKLRPVVIDESLTDLENLMLAREMGLQRCLPEGLQGPVPRDADGRRRAEVQHVPLRAGSHMPGGFLHPLRGDRFAHTRALDHRGQCAAVCALGECGLDGEVPGALRDEGREACDEAAR